MTWELLLLKGVNTAAVLVFFAAIVLLLRFLYGPGGKFRDPEWDKWNETARRELEQSEDKKSEARLREQFMEYASSFFSGNADEDMPLQLKVDHTLRVVRHAEEIASREEDFAGPGLAHALRLAALFHDVGRFEQLQRYHTFADDLSCNHGVMGAKVIRAQQFLRNEPQEIRRIVLQAVAAHNRPTLPSRLSGKLRPVLFALRDADKLDILRIMEEHLSPGKKGDRMVLLHLKDEPASYSPPVLDALLQGTTARYRDMHFFNDFRILLCSWLHDLHFVTTYRILKRENHLSRIIDGIEGLPELRGQLHFFAETQLNRKEQLVSDETAGPVPDDTTAQPASDDAPMQPVSGNTTERADSRAKPSSHEAA